MREHPNPWLVPRIWDGGQCFILGGGPSLANVNIEFLRGHRCIAVNNAFKLASWIDVMFFGDARWYDYEGKRLLEFSGLKITLHEKHRDKPGIKILKRRNSPWGISTDPGILSWNLSSGACAINLAYHFGVKRIILLGFDMKTQEGRHNYHNDYLSNISQAKKKNPDARYARFLRPFPSIAKDLKELDVECLNATEGSALTVFPMVKLEDVL